MRVAERVALMGGEAAFRVRARALELEAAGRDVIHLEMGEPGFPTPARIVEAGIEALRAGRTGYAPPAGILPLREAIAAEAAQRRGAPVDPSSVVVLPGAKPGIFFAFLALVERGDEVVYPDPGFPIFRSLVRALGAVPRPYPAGGAGEGRPDLDRLEALLTDRTRLLVLNSPSNPTGVVLEGHELDRIAGAVRDRDLWVLSDEIYARLLYEGTHESIAARPGMAERTVVVDGLSKTFAMTGWRLGWAVAPLPLAAVFERLAVNDHSCAVHFVQHAALAAFRGPPVELAANLAAFRARRDVLVESLRALPGVRCTVPEGAFFVFADLREAKQPDLAVRLLEEKGVACVAGEDFGEAGTGFLRFSLTEPAPRVREAASRLRNLLAR